jgi:hypothetical protein
MGEEVTQFELANFNNNDSAGCGNCSNVNGGSSVDEVDKAMPSQDCEEIKLIEKCMKPHAKKLDKPPPSSPPSTTHDGASEKARKWYSISFMHRNATSASAVVAANSRSNSCEGKKNSENMKMDKHRHSWHLNDSAVVEM